MKHLFLYFRELKLLLFSKAVRQARKWQFERPFSELRKIADSNHEKVLTYGKLLIENWPHNAKGYAVLQACQKADPKNHLSDIAGQALQVGMKMVTSNDLPSAVKFFQSLSKIFPDELEGYSILYNFILISKNEIQALKKESNHNKQKKLLFSFSVWSDRYISLFNDVCLASLLAPQNIPYISQIRDIHFEIFAHENEISKIEGLRNISALKKFCNVTFIPFPEKLVSCKTYFNEHGLLRYYIYGGFHHLSIEHAKILDADVICLGPDNLYSNNTFKNLVNYIDEGYNAVLFTATRSQAEFVLDILKKETNKTSGVLDISAKRIAHLSTQFIHHDFMQYVVTSEQMPPWRSAFFIPCKTGLNIRCYHYHPAIISSKLLEKTDGVEWNYSTLDSNTMEVLCPDESEWEKLKVIDNSDDCVMLDIAFGYPDLPATELNQVFNREYFDNIKRLFSKFNYWCFKFNCNYKVGEATFSEGMRSIRTFAYDKDKKLQPVLIDIDESTINVQQCLDKWIK